MSHRVYVSASTQSDNVGVANYGTEQDEMMSLADRVKYWLGTQVGKFVVFRNMKGWSLEQTVHDCNSLACELFIDNHSNAGVASAAGTEDYYYGQGGTASKSYRIAKLLYEHIAPISPGTDRGIHADTSLYKSGLYVIQNTNPPAALIEHIFHTNIGEVKDLMTRRDVYAKAEAQAICEFFGEKWSEPVAVTPHLYKVVAGDTLYGIAKKLKTTVAKLVELNHIKNPSAISVGQILKY